MIGFDNIHEHIIPLENFELKWRFIEEPYDKLPQLHLDQLKPLNQEASRFLWDYILESGLHKEIPFSQSFFRNVEKAKITTGNEAEVKKWLYQRGLAFGKEVFLLWDTSNALIVPWKLLIKYYDSFYYAISDDLTVFDSSLNWALLFYHEHEVYFGTNENFKPSPVLKDFDFIW